MTLENSLYGSAAKNSTMSTAVSIKIIIYMTLDILILYHIFQLQRMGETTSVT